MEGSHVTLRRCFCFFHTSTHQLGRVWEESCATRVSNLLGSQFSPQRPNHSGGAAEHSYMLRWRQIKTIMVTSNMLR